MYKMLRSCVIHLLKIFVAPYSDAANNHQTFNHRSPWRLHLGSNVPILKLYCGCHLDEPPGHIKVDVRGLIDGPIELRIVIKCWNAFNSIVVWASLVSGIGLSFSDAHRGETIVRYQRAELTSVRKRSWMYARQIHPNVASVLCGICT